MSPAPVPVTGPDDAVWQALAQLENRLRQRSSVNADRIDGDWKRLADHVGASDARLKDLLDWKQLGVGIDALRVNAGLAILRLPDNVIGGIFIALWLMFGFGIGWGLGLIVAAACTVGLVLALRNKNADGLMQSIHVRLLHFVGRDDSRDYPLEFSALTVRQEQPLRVERRFWSFKGVDPPASGYAVGMFSRDDDPIGYLVHTGKGARLDVLQNAAFDIAGTGTKAGFEGFAEADRATMQELDQIEKRESQECVLGADLAAVRDAWTNIVLPGNVKEHLLRAMILFAHGDPSAPKGILLKGPPGTGKSLVAGTMAESFGAHFFKLSVADLKAGFIGQSAGNVRQLWEEARTNAPAVIFVDECEGIFTRRGSDQGDTFVNELVQAFLTEWDGIGGTSRVLVIGATNRPDLLDDAIVSRFTDIVDMPPVGADQRREMVMAVARQLGLRETLSGAIAEAMGGLSGREVRNALQQAMRLAAPDAPTESHFRAGLARVRGKASTATDPDAGWDSLILPETLITRLKVTCQMVREAEGLAAKGIPVPRTMLLYGPPGTGKTQIARTIANEAGVGFIVRTTADIKGQFLGQAAARVAQTFETARTASPCILFLDEIDALTARRGGDEDALQTEALVQLLQELDGVASKPGFVFVMAATNRLDAIDAAILSRFAQRLEISLPDEQGRAQLLEALLKGRPVDAELGFGDVARRTAGYSGRDLRELVTEGFNFAVERTLAAGQSAVDTRLSMDDLSRAMVGRGAARS